MQLAISDYHTILKWVAVDDGARLSCPELYLQLRCQVLDLSGQLQTYIHRMQLKRADLCTFRLKVRPHGYTRFSAFGVGLRFLRFCRRRRGSGLFSNSAPPPPSPPSTDPGGDSPAV